MLRRDAIAPSAVLLVWTIGIAVACMQLVNVQQRAAEDLMLREARALFQQIVLAQAWNAGFGGVYVQTPAAANATLCPPLGELVVLPDGREFQRIDPPCMAQQLATLARARGYEHSFRMVGNPVRHPRVELEDWEAEAFRRIAAGAREFWIIEPDAGAGRPFRYLAPLVADQSCSQCHAEHACAPGEICGGIAITLPGIHDHDVTMQAMASVRRWFIAVWIVGGAALVLGVLLLVRSRRAALEAARAKSDFLAAMSHELRTPLNGILGLTDLALAEALSEQQREYLLTSRHSAERLQRLFTFMLEYARLDVREYKAGAGEPFALEDCLQVLRHDFKVRALEKGLTFHMTVDPDVPPVLTGDMNMLVVALSQLLDNAVKFTDSGGVELRVAVQSCGLRGWRSLLGWEAPTCCLAFTVQDTGPGIPRELAGKLFEPFVQGDSSFSRRHAGVGLGLALAQRMAQAMGGRVTVASEAGQGALVQLTARFALPE